MNTPKKRIIAVHMLNDFSGSPMVLRQALEVLKQNFEVHLYTATPSGNGILSNIEGITTHSIFYKWHRNKFITLTFYIWAQLSLFSRLLLFLRREDTVYINTLLPFGAALAGVFARTKVVYHVHEVSITPALFKTLLVKAAKFSADELLFVSNYVKTQFDFAEEKTTVIYNALPDTFLKNAALRTKERPERKFTILMLCSAKAYKGIYEFVKIAEKLYFLEFRLVLNASVEETNAFKLAIDVPPNCLIYPVQKDTSNFYLNADLIVNLSRPQQWVETFGMTILEGMVYGLPSIVPPIGGITEVVENEIEGLQIDVANIHEVVWAIVKLSSNQSYYNKLAEAARKKAEKFSQQAFSNQISLCFYVVKKTTEVTSDGILVQKMEFQVTK
ncbi:glycosyltransferase family 4 protein [Pedobacter cryoconitis]|uniref:glycosyltransferase family 4 protein n=1 Tax=Pedobacter cryoconitis TaxID=188932 RepID=UPI00160D22FC|nr:glycosyltransferase family 4 protein [Pedobacter cryoconitis]MBB5647179.1 glycosyltransferase involved in cell wall biosynthesis [Pedobacter cryoconitis]